MPDPLLRRAAKVCAPGDPGVAEVAADLIRTMAVLPGCRGLAAPQIGWLLRIVAVDVAEPPRQDVEAGPLVLVNPQLIVSEGLRTEVERCRSVPDVVARVHRADHILVVGFSAAGTAMTLELAGADAALVLHELDHLDGVLMVDRLQSLSDLSPQPVELPKLPEPTQPTEPPDPPVQAWPRSAGRAPTGRATCPVCESPITVEGLCMGCWEVC